MLKYQLICIILLPLAACAYEWHEEPTWMGELTELCQGTEDKYYVDSVERKCCKCSLCYHFDQERKPACGEPKSCVARFADDCIYSDFEEYFPGPDTPTTANNIPVNTSETSTLSGTVLSRKEPTEGNSSNVLIAVAGTLGTLLFILLVVVVIRSYKTGKVLCISKTLSRLKQQLCKTTESSPEKLKKYEDEEKSSEPLCEKEISHCVDESSTVGNASPPQLQQSSDQFLSQYGPQEMVATQNITGASEQDPGQSEFDSLGGHRSRTSGTLGVQDRQCQITNPMHRGTYVDRHAGAPDISSPGNGNVIIAQSENGGPITINKVEVHVPCPGHQPTYPEQRVHNSFRQEFSHPRLTDNNQAIERPSFLMPSPGSYVTSAAAPLPTKAGDQGCSHIFRRQPSEISSHSSGPVENESCDIASTKWQHSEARKAQDLQYALYHGQASSTDMSDSCSMVLNRCVPAQLSERASQYDTGHRSSRQDSSISIAHPPISDLGLSNSE